jgi:hypothetical protein
LAFALNFDKHLKKGLDDNAPQFEWKTGWSADDQRWKVDVAGLSKNCEPRVLIEVELKKDNPVENVVKIWRWAKGEKKTQRILFLQAFSSHYIKPKKGAHKATKHKQYVRSCFIGERMMEDRSVGLHIDYQHLPIYTTTHAGKLIPFTPRIRRGSVTKEGGAAMNRAAGILAIKIARLLRSKTHR